MRRRLVANHRETASLIAFFDAEGTLQPLDGMREIDAITDSLRHLIRPIVTDVRGVKAVGERPNKTQMEETQ